MNASESVTIVLSAYGPKAVTSRAIKRAQSMLGGRGRVVVIAGSLAGIEAVEALDPRGRVSTVDGIGPEALQAALDEFGPGPVLFVHDDVALGPESLPRMLAALDRHGGVVVPLSNDPGDNFFGGMPPSQKAAGFLRQAERQSRGPERTTQLVRPSCVLAPHERFRELAARHLTAPAAMLGVQDEHFTVVPGAAAAHDSSCLHRRPPAELVATRPLLVAALIVRDEEEMLPGCLASLEGIVDRVEICDTGSTDRTIEIARAAGANVIERPWRDDFAWARNEVLDNCEDAWYFLHIDADERLECADTEAFHARLAESIGEHVSRNVKLVNVREDGTAATEAQVPRLHRAGLVRYEGAFHELAVAVDPRHHLETMPVSGIAIRHLGYTKRVMEERGKNERNLTMARQLYEADPSATHAFHYARALYAEGTDRALERKLLLELIEVGHEGRVGRAYFQNMLAQRALDEHRYEEALEHAHDAVAAVPADKASHVILALAARALGRYDLILQAAELEGSPSPDPMITLAVSADALKGLQGEAHLACGDPEMGVRLVREALEGDPESFDGWAVIARALAADPPGVDVQTVADLLRLAEDDAIGALGRQLRPAVTAEVLASYLEQGGQAPAAPLIGLTASLLQGRDDLFGRMLPYTGLLDDETVANLAERARARGRSDLAQQLSGTVPVS